MADHKIYGNDGAGNVQAPERIWASNRTNGNCVVSFTSRSEEYSIEYIRADVAASQLAAANARADKARDDALVEAADIILADNYDDPDDAADAILAIRDKPAPGVCGWQPIETAPENVQILVCQTKNGIISIARGKNEHSNWRTGISPMDYIAGVTHWMPLPAPPEA